jgi:hypothetical protein
MSNWGKAHIRTHPPPHHNLTSLETWYTAELDKGSPTFACQSVSHSSLFITTNFFFNHRGLMPEGPFRLRIPFETAVTVSVIINIVESK